MGGLNEHLKNRLRQSLTVLFKVLPLISFTIPLILLYFLNPIDPLLRISTKETFELMWKGRTFQLFFIWLTTLEFILDWESIKINLNRQSRATVIFYSVFLLLPTLYILLGVYFGWNAFIANWARNLGVIFFDSMPLAIEYVVFSGLFCLIIWVSYGRKGLQRFILPVLFLFIVGLLYTIDNVFPYGEFTPFQLLVPTTTALAAGVLGLMGNSVVLGTDIITGMPTLDVTGQLGTAKFAIAWPCAGIESLLIFTAVALLLLQRMPFSWKMKIIYFISGAAVTYLINILRISTIFVIGMQYGVTSVEVQNFHFYYGPLYSMTWIICYPLILLVAQNFWQKARRPRLAKPTPA